MKPTRACFPKYTNNSYNSKNKQTNKQKNPQPSKKCAEDLNKHLSKEDIQMANRHMKRCATLLIIRKCISNYRVIESSCCGSAVMNPTRNHEVTGSILGLAQWVKEPALL